MSPLETFLARLASEAQPPIGAVPANIVQALHECAEGSFPPDLVLMQLLLVSRSEVESERALGSAIWEALEHREAGKAERLGAVQKLWDSARNLARAVLQ